MLRSRILRGVQAGTLDAGDRLPSGRELVAELGVDHRTILSAYRQLAVEGLVTMRERGGVYVAPRAGGPGGIPPLPQQWFVEILTEGLKREIPAPELHEWLRRCTETLRLRAAVVASTEDQLYGLCRELRDDFGLAAEGVVASLLRDSAPPLAVRRADLLVTTAAHAARVRQLGAELRKEVTVIDVRPDLVTGEWALLLRRPVYAIVATREFGEMLRSFFANVPGADNLRIVVLGRDDVSAIPPDAPTYVTQRARTALGGSPIPGRIIPAARTLSSESAREIFAFIVRLNVDAMGRITP